jgi:hypothetical protein
MIFKKAGQPSWVAWVPVYNSWKMLELGGQPGWWALLAFVPVVNIVAVVFLYMAMYQIGLNFGKSGAFVLLAIFLPLIWMIWLAVDKTAVWKGPGENVQAVPAGPAPVSAPVNQAAPTPTDQPQPPVPPAQPPQV